MGRIAKTWRGWSPARRAATVGGLVLIVAGVAIAGYLALRRPADVANSEAEFVEKRAPKPKQPTDKTIDWPTYGLDDARTRFLPSARVRPPFKGSKWSFQSGKLLEFSPIIVDDILYFMDIDARFYALDAKRGKKLWERRVGKLNASAPTYDNGELFAVNLAPGQAVSLRAKDGKVRWKTPLPGRSESSPLVHEGRVIFGCECGKVFGLDRDTGKIRWEVDVAGEVKGALARDGDTVYGGSYGGDVFAIDARSGKVEWRSSTVGGSFLRGGGVYSTPTVAYGRVYLGSIDSRVYSFEQDTGEIAWTKSTGAEVYSGPAVAETGKTDPTVYVGSADDNFYALDAKTGETIWQRNVGGDVTGAGSVIGNVVYVSVIGDPIGTLGLDLRNGKTVFEHELGEYNPAISDGEVLYLTGYSTLRAFPPKPRKRKGGAGGRPGNREAASKRPGTRAKQRD